MDFMDLEKSYYTVKSEPVCHILITYDTGGKLLNGVKSMYVNSLACIRVKGGKSKCFRIDRGVRQGCIMSP